MCVRMTYGLVNSSYLWLPVGRSCFCYRCHLGFARLPGKPRLASQQAPAAPLHVRPYVPWSLPCHCNYICPSYVPLRVHCPLSMPRSVDKCAGATSTADCPITLRKHIVCFFSDLCIFGTLKMAKMDRFCHFGGMKNGTSGVRIKIPRPLLETQTTPETLICLRQDILKKDSPLSRRERERDFVFSRFERRK